MPAKANKIGFNSAACFNAIKKYSDGLLTRLAEKLTEVMKKEIYTNGNGSPEHMKLPTIAQVCEILHEVTDEHIRIDVGIDPAMARSISEATYVKVCVVLFGNGEIWTKPGQATWKKYVSAKGPSGADYEYRIADFEQPDVSQTMMENIKKQMDVYIKEYINVLNSWLDGNFFAQFVTVS